MMLSAACHLAWLWPGDFLLPDVRDARQACGPLVLVFSLAKLPKERQAVIRAIA